MSSEELPPEPQRPSAKAAERLQVIVDAAERAAMQVIDDAEKEAQRYIEDAKAHADRIAAARLREAADELEGRSGDPAPAAPGREAEEAERPAEPLRVVRPAEPDAVPPHGDPVAPAPAAPGREAEKDSGPFEAPRVSPQPSSTSKPGSAAARLLATQMAVSGSSREEIETRLRNGFEIEDAAEILDAILGPEE